MAKSSIYGAAGYFEAADEVPAAPYVVIGIDFGTTYSGVSWTRSEKTDHIDQVSSWEGDGRDSEKVPSRICYDKNGKVTAWGFKADPDYGTMLQWFKLLLSEDACEQGGRKVVEAKDLMMKLGKTPVEVVADFLEKLWEHALELIELRLTKMSLDNRALRVVLTVPANWDRKACSLTRDAAVKAGITASRYAGKTTLRLVTEPEAAALAAWTESGLQWRPDIVQGDTFVVCDAGGGTVDLISYEVKSLSPLRLEMCVEPTGDLCGAVYLDAAFENHIRTYMGTQAFDKLTEKVKTKAFNADWERGIKRKFNGGREEWPVDIPGYKPKRPLFGHRPSNTITLAPGHVSAIFQPTCGKVVSLIRTQVSEVHEITTKDPKIILLVGGFGENDFLRDQIKKTFNNITIQRPTRAWSAISRGAVVKGLSTNVEDEAVTNYVSKLSYGIMYSTKFNSEKHREEDKFLCPYTLEEKARDQVKWYLCRGQSVAKLAPVSYVWCRYLRERAEILKKNEVVIWQSEKREPISRWTKDVKKLCKINCHFDEETFDLLDEQENAKGDNYRTLVYTLKMREEAGDLVWSVYYRGEQKSLLQIQVTYE